MVVRAQHDLSQSQSVPECESHPKYSFEDANVSFIVEDRVKFDIYKQFLQRDSKLFGTLLTTPSSHPDGIYRVPGLKIHEFESLLEFFYEGMYRVSLTDTPIESWVNLLSISTSMEFPRVREHAITAIDAYQGQFNSNRLGKLTPVRTIEMAKLYDVKKWLEPAYEALAERVEVITEEEAETIGARGVLVIMKAREKRRGVIRHMRVAPVDDNHPTGGRALPVDVTLPSDLDPPDACQEDKVLKDVLCETAAQSSTIHQGSEAPVVGYTADVKENENFPGGMKSVDPPVPSPPISHSLDVAKPFECKDTVERRESPSGYRATTELSDQRLDSLYHEVLTAYPDHEEFRLVLAAIMVLSGHLEPTPSHIEFLLGLPEGELVSRLPRVFPMLNVGGQEDAISLHLLFRDFLMDEERAGSFHIEIHTQKQIIARLWLEALSTKRIRTCSTEQLWANQNKPFFKKWIGFCISIDEPSRELLDALWNVNLAATFVISGTQNWEEFYEGLVPWVKRYGENQDRSEIGGHAKAGRDSQLKVTVHPPNDNGQCSVEASSHRITNSRNGPDPVEGLVHKFQNWPPCFHLERPWFGPQLDSDVLYWIVNQATGCSNYTSLHGTRPSPTSRNVYLTECCCNLSIGKELPVSSHLTYQTACLNIVKAYTSRYHILLQWFLLEANEDHIEEAGLIFLNLTSSSLFIHCHLDATLLSLCRDFFNYARVCLMMRIHSDAGEVGKRNMLKWLETFPETKFTAERDGLRAQVLGLPWEQWDKNFRQLHKE